MPDKKYNVLFLNPRMDINETNEFERHILDIKQNGIKMDKSKLIRAFVRKFNENPLKMLKFIDLK